ncbi:MAG TPA: hypothetical protein VE712_01620, partial [Actinomycetota bacterium]|nr:hypothetical protein [Actinomycetota bacterium]
MSTATFAPAQASAVKSRTLLVSRSLAWVEGLRLIRHPLVVASALLGSVLFALLTRHEAPVLNRHDSLITEALLPAAGGILVAAHLATLRARRHRTVELHRSTPSSATVETAGHLLGVAIASVAALGLALLYLAYLEIAGGVTSPRPLVVLTGPALVLLGGALGVAGARWLPYTAAGPLLLIGVVGISFVLMGDCSTNTGDCRIRYLSPLVLSEAWTATPSELAYRAVGAHLTYLGGLALAASAGALLRFRRDLVTALVGIVALGVAVVGAYFQA